MLDIWLVNGLSDETLYYLASGRLHQMIAVFKLLHLHIIYLKCNLFLGFDDRRGRGIIHELS